MAVTVDRSYLQRVVAVINNKGGVGKTTLVSNIGGLLARSGWRVLIVDLDPQGNVGDDLGYVDTEGDDSGAGLSKALLFGDDPHPLIAVRENLDVIPGGQRINDISDALGQKMGRGGDETLYARLSLALMLAKVSANYDLILLDCPPNNDTIQSIAAAASRYMLIPGRPEKASKKGLKFTAERQDRVLDLNPDLDLLGVVIFDSSKSASRVRSDWTEAVVADLGGEGAEGIVFDNYIRHAEGVAKAARDKGMLVHELDEFVQSAPKWYERLKKGEAPEVAGPKSSGSVADSLVAVTEEFINRLIDKEQSEAAAAGEAERV
ncbi:MULTISPECIES: ParA family protein [unclassified Curtobacterium]|uniref:ParA family protein n=1 Tax=unclassified Curtobacterium TaxID=257496 RepID=UPI00188D39BE|nr:MULTISPECIES: ParA family protein [unclassified Curtobacterium]MBF4591704.1 ParA family protein [Curtobacterium sp. VKM Ac-1395]MCY1692968.1 ParA family protein [Curtobacterium sp. SL109]